MKDPRQTQLLDAPYLHGDQPKSGTQGSSLKVRVHPEPRLAVQSVRKVDLPIRLQLLALVLREDAVNQFPRLAWSEKRIVEVLKVPVYPNDRRHTHRQVQVGRIPRYDFSKDLSNIHRYSLSLKHATLYQTMTREISSMLVIPCSTLSRPSSRKDVIPSALATRHISSALLRSTISLSTASVTGMTS